MESNPDSRGNDASGSRNQPSGSGNNNATAGVGQLGAEGVRAYNGPVTSGEGVPIVPDSSQQFEVEVDQPGNPSSGSLQTNANATGKSGLFAKLSTLLEDNKTSRTSTKRMSLNLGSRSGSMSGSDGEGEDEYDEDNSMLSYEESLELGTIRHMKSSGFLSQLKGDIAKYMFDITKPSLHSFVIPDRADKEVLSQIYDYLIWVGMRGTAAVLLSESPFPIREQGQSSTLGESVDHNSTPGKDKEGQDTEKIPLLATLLSQGQQGQSQEAGQKKSTTFVVDQISQTPTPSVTEMGNQTPTGTDDLSQVPLDKNKVSGEEMNLIFEKPKMDDKKISSTSSAVVNKQLSKPYLTANSGDLLTGSPLSSPAPSLAKVVSGSGSSGLQGKVTDNIENSVPSKGESFDDLLMAYIGPGEVEKANSGSAPQLLEESSALEESEVKTPEENLMAFTFTSTPVQESHPDATATAPASNEPLQEPSFLSTNPQNDGDQPPSSETESSSLSSAEMSASGQRKPTEDKELENFQEKTPEKSQPLDDNSTSDVLSMEEQENADTEDISLASSAVKETPLWDLVVRVEDIGSPSNSLLSGSSPDGKQKKDDKPEIDFDLGLGLDLTKSQNKERLENDNNQDISPASGEVKGTPASDPVKIKTPEAINSLSGSSLAAGGLSGAAAGAAADSGKVDVDVVEKTEDVEGDTSISDVLSLPLSENDQNTVDASLASEAEGKSVCDHVVKIKD